ncbi:Hypothetical predicted protein [Octopus vulgaris]|uniref:Uncharacterized protein n=1 Tax=Octopus vulgaris TaxID=6645 RepID=A0AA36B1Y0_OCTVU|nr:Hypothetical predicted protein [Octopus vulgaris]
MVPLKSKDSCFLFKDHEVIMKRWAEHFPDLFYNPSVIDENVISNMPQKDIIHEMIEHPTIGEIKKTIKELNTGKVPGLDGIPVEILLYGSNRLAVEIQHLISDIWLGAPVPHHWADAILISLFKGKGFKSECGNYRDAADFITHTESNMQLIMNGSFSAVSIKFDIISLEKRKPSRTSAAGNVMTPNAISKTLYQCRYALLFRF